MGHAVLDSSNIGVQYLSDACSRLRFLFLLIGDISYSTYDDPYVFLVHEIIEQMLSKKAASKIYDRLVSLCCGQISPDRINLLSDETLKSIGTSKQKVCYIRNLTNAVKANELDFSVLPQLSDADVIKKLRSVKGIGNWTAKMYLIFVLDRQNVLPYEDGAFRQGYRWLYNTDKIKPTDIIERCKCWSPYSSIAARYLYRAVDAGYIKSKLNDELEEL